MKLSQNSLNRFASSDRRFERLQEHFGRFVSALDYFNEPRCPVEGIKVEALDGRIACQVTYRTVVIRFALNLVLAEADAASGKITCSLVQSAGFGGERALGSFSFNFAGVTDVQTQDGLDNADLETMAPDIVLEFLRAALADSAP